MINRQTKVVKDGQNQFIGIITVEGTVDSALCFSAANSHPQVARKRKNGSGISRWIQTQNHDRVRALADTPTVAEGICVGRIWIKTGPVIATSDQDILCREIHWCQGIIDYWKPCCWVKWFAGGG